MTEGRCIFGARFVTDQPSLFPECGHFSEEVFERAKALVARYGREAPTVAAIRSSDDMFDEPERAWWLEISRTCKCILHPLFTAMHD
jgi:hypothetical protein